MSAALAGSGWMAELLAAFALTLAAAYWLLEAGGGPRDQTASVERRPGKG